MGIYQEIEITYYAKCDVCDAELSEAYGEATGYVLMCTDQDHMMDHLDLVGWQLFNGKVIVCKTCLNQGKHTESGIVGPNDTPDINNPSTSNGG